jgi:hypothetical protein
MTFSQLCRPNKLAKVVMLSIYIQKMPGLNLSWGADSSEVFHGFIHAFQVNTDIVPQIRLRATSFHILSSSLFTNHYTIHCCIVLTGSIIE